MCALRYAGCEDGIWCSCMNLLISLLATILGVYAVLLALYFATCGLIVWTSRRTRVPKIQEKKESRAQIQRDTRQSMISIGGISAMFGAGQWMYQTLGWGIQAHEVSVMEMTLSFLISMILFDTWFYWLHRLIHLRPFFRRVHVWHHMTATPEVWSNNSDLLIDNCFLQSYWLVAHFLIPIAPIVLFLHKLYDHVMGIIGHSGYEFAGKACWPPSPLVSVTHHDQHHRFVNCNYATHFTFWDRLMGTLHPTHDAEVKRNICKSSL